MKVGVVGCGLVGSAAAFAIVLTGFTNYGIGAGLAKIARVIRDDDRTVLTLSMPTDSIERLDGVSLSLPRILGASGVLATVRPPLSPEEDSALQRSAQVLREAKSRMI